MYYWPYAAALLCFVYVLLRAILIPLTFDEIWTVETIPMRHLSEILAYSNLGSNSHLLNSLLIRIIHNIAPWISFDEHWLYRLPNVLAFLLYAWFSIRLIRELPNKWLQIMAFVLCFLNPFILEFFSLARGYGLAMACNAAAFYFLKQTLSPAGSNSSLIATLVWSCLAVLSNFVWLNFYLALLPVLVYIEWLKHKKFSWRFFLQLGIPTLLLFALIIKPILKLREGNELWYGGKKGLVYDSFTSLVQGVMGFRVNDFTAHMVLLALAIVLVFHFLVHVRNGISTSKALRSDSLLFLLIFIFLSASSLLQYILFHTPFLVNRTALVFILPLIWLLLSATASIMGKKFWQPAFAASLIFCFAALLNFIQEANLAHSISWPFDAKSDVVLEYLNKEGEARQDTIYLDHSWIIGASLGYVHKAENYPWVKRIVGEPDSVRRANADYYYLYDNDRPYAGYSAYNAIPDSFFRDTALFFPKQDLLLLKVRE